MKANSKDIEWLLENATQYMISKETNVPQSKSGTDKRLTNVMNTVRIRLLAVA